MDEKFKFLISEEEKGNFITNNLSCSEIKKHKKYNDILNVIAPIVALVILDFDIFTSYKIIWLAIIYIVFDIFMIMLDNFLFNIYPYKQSIKLQDITKRQEYVQRLQIKFEKIQKEFLSFRQRECSNCYHYLSRSKRCDSQNKCSIWKDYEFYQKKLDKEKKILEAEFEKIEQASIETNNKISNEYDNKLEYFKDLEKKYSFYAASKELDILLPIVKSLNELLEILNKKPNVIVLIPNNIYLYLDELQKVIIKLDSLNEEQKSRYYTMISEISKALGKNIEDLNRRIDKTETEDIEISLNVLYSELVNKEEKDV